MNTTQLAQRLLRYLTISDLANLPADGALGLLDAMNAAIQEYYAIVPTSFKGTTFSGVLTPAVPITATFTNGSNYFTGWSATPAQKGFTIVAGTDPRQNTLVAPKQMLDVYTGPTGTFTAQVYGDCLHMEQIIERFTADPILVDFNIRLQRNENWRRIATTGPWPGSFYQYYAYGSYSTRQIRTPWQYWIERQGESQNAFPPFILRCDSLPDQEYRVRIEGLLAPTQVQLNDLTVPQALSLDSYIVESTVLPMAVYHLTEHPLWASKSNFKMVQAKYQGARKMAMDRTPDQGSSINLVGTPRGF